MGSHHNRSRAEIGQENYQRFQVYLDNLRVLGQPLPAGRNGKASVSAIAMACGLDRQVFYANPRVKQLLQEAEESLGVGVYQEAGDTTEVYQKQLDVRDRRIKHLEEQLAARTAEVEQLRGTVKELTKRLQQARKEVEQLSFIEEYTMLTGRRVIP